MKIKFSALSLLLTAIALLFFTHTSFSQTAPSQYFSISYVKLTDASKASDYSDLLEHFGKAISQYRVKLGIIQSWYVYELVMPQGSKNEYDFVVVMESKDMQVLIDDTLINTDMFKKVYPAMSAEERETIFKKYAAARSVVKTEIFQELSATHASATPPLYAKVNFMKALPGKDSDYVNLEENVWMRLHKKGMEQRIMADWALDKKIMPMDMKSDFDYLSVDFYNSINAMFDTRYFQNIKTLWPGEEMSKLMAETQASRTFVRSEIWKLSAYADATNSK